MTRTAPDLQLPDLAGRRALVTGGSDGIGLRIAARLARAGAEIVLPVRNRTKGDAAVDRIRADAPRARVILHDLDLASLASVAALGEELRGDGTPLNLLINNAGLMSPPSRQLTADGFEAQWGTNHLGHVALVAALLPLLREGHARVVSQISVAASSGRIRWDDLNAEHSYDAMTSYRQSKIALGLFARELQRQSVARGWGVVSVLSHPGVAPTSLLAARPELERATDTRGVRLIRWMSARGLFVGTPDSAALPALLAATAADAVGGHLYGPSGPGRVGGAPAEQRLYRPLRDDEAARRVWTVSQELTGVVFPTD
ncbi:NAD(P)-dependent dehydrogenase (short-subunit alcohol dehydrogenase family) [Microbacterium sp. SORGH_AS428]|uniref:SDR family oxidoreductase n=1 Tax=Microbacterium sp. SORGH_AS_0428 TaxID=3041788 RepID=UPI00285B667D|nr:SDR family oxidoreductase [Microbacterium sp. SORGH_AS_0428]MDR6201126.1 NAD(P)-dependent dehydrogenase (short-subunit alcohol dehydrogenase family) [Microbacterium sp. SORGH_AS_0428]